MMPPYATASKLSEGAVRPGASNVCPGTRGVTHRDVKLGG